MTKKGDDLLKYFDLFLVLGRNFKLLSLTSIGAAIIGIILSFGFVREYTSSTKMVVEVEVGNEMPLKGIQAIAGIAGYDLDQMNGGLLSPSLFPEIIYSTPFMRELLQDSIKLPGEDKEITVYGYFDEFQKPSIYVRAISSIFSLVGSDSNVEIDSNSKFLEISRKDNKIITDFKERIYIHVDKKTNIISIAVKMQDKYVAAEVLDKLVFLLKDYLTEYRIKKSRQNFVFVQERFEESKLNYELLQEELARYLDRNRDLNSKYAQVEYERLSDKRDFAYDIYRSLASQKEQAEINLIERTPVFSELEPIRIPLKKSEPRRSYIAIGFFAFSFAITFVFILVKERK